MIKKLLIANRGEIACRIIKTAQKMGIETVAVYSDADANSIHTFIADSAVHIGGAASTESYLNQHNILEAIKLSGADAIHPGYGFLSENPKFAQLMQDHDITFVGPSCDAIASMGDKIKAKKIAKNAGVNIVPGYVGEISDLKHSLKIAAKVGYPIMLKAAAGGGGKGIRIVRTEDEMKQAFISTQNEARNNFSDSRTFIEKFIENPRHIEVQIIADKFGNYICLGERECSIQRHHQKVIEEAPSAFVDEKLRKKMYGQCVSLAKKVKYYSAGTVEFIVDQNHQFYFLEMNTRLQVEHPVTEMITGVDIVEQMLRIAIGEKLSFKQKDIALNGWAFESRIYAEDPSIGFLPSTGQVTTYKEPYNIEGVRVDSGVYEGFDVSMFYDAMVAKLCTHAPTRREAIEVMKRSLSKFIIRGISHNISFLQSIFSHEKFALGDISTSFIANEYKDGFTSAVLTDESSAVLLSIAVYIFLEDAKRATTISGQMRGFGKIIGTRWVVRLEDENYPVTVRPIEDGYKISFMNRRLYITSQWAIGNKLINCAINGQEYSAQVELAKDCMSITYMSNTVRASIFTPRAAELQKFIKDTSGDDDNPDIIANISGAITDIKVREGDTISRGQPVAVLEAMKMENIITSAADGIVRNVYKQKGDNISSGEVLIEVIPRKEKDAAK